MFVVVYLRELLPSRHALAGLLLLSNPVRPQKGFEIIQISVNNLKKSNQVKTKI